MFQCLGLGTVETGGCGEDWWHPECLLGLPREWQKMAKAQDEIEEGDHNGTAEPVDGQSTKGEGDEEEIPLPPGFPEEDEFETFICYKCLESNPWLKRYANTPGCLPPVFKDKDASPSTTVERADGDKGMQEEEDTDSRKRKAEDEEEADRYLKRTKSDTADGLETIQEEPSTSGPAKHKHESLPSDAPTGSFSLFLKEDFREHLCHCPDCFHHLVPHPQLREEEETYEPPLSEDGDEANGGGSQGTGSLLDRGEAALSNMDRVRAIEGAMVYNHLRDKVKAFLKPFAETGQAVSADDIKSYFEKLRGDDSAIKEAGGQASAFGGNRSDDNGNGDGGDNRREQNGTFRSIRQPYFN
jgi:E3 ubiquitin-protein ligase UBR7